MTVVTKKSKPAPQSVIWVILQCDVCHEKWVKRLDEPHEQRYCPGCNHVGTEIDRVIKKAAA